MRNLNELDRYRQVHLELHSYGGRGNHEQGVFLLPSPVNGTDLRIIASSGSGWDHVSIACANRCPSWEEMDFVARQFFKDNEVAMQLHVPRTQHINCHEFTLHLWRPNRGKSIPQPPTWMVGPAAKGE